MQERLIPGLVSVNAGAAPGRSCPSSGECDRAAPRATNPVCSERTTLRAPGPVFTWLPSDDVPQCDAGASSAVVRLGEGK